jgi:tight adherence protein B
VVGFSDIVTVFSSFTSDRERLAGAVNLLDAEGETALFDGIIKGLEQFDNFPDLRHKYLVVLSDGADTVSTAGVEEAIQQALQGGTVVYSIGLTSKEFNFEGIEKIAGSTGGYMLSTSDSAMLEQLYEVALQKIQGIYRITYESGIQEADSIAAEIIVEEGSYRDSLNFSFENPYTVFSGSTVVSQDRSQAISNLVFLDKWWIKLIIFISIFVSVTLFIYAISTIMIPSNRDLKSRTDYFLYNIAEPGAEPPSDEKRARGRFFSRSAKKNRKSSDKKDFTSVFDEKLKRAGVSMSGSRFVLIHIISVAVATLVVFLLTRNLLVTFAVVVIVIFLPFLFVNFKIGQKLKKFNEQLPDTLQLIEGALKAGYSLNQALYMVIKETKPPISEEFSMALNEIRMGLTEKAALENMAKRINSELFSWVILAINIQREVGGNLAEIMDIIANTIRDKERVLRQIKGLTAEGKLSAYVLIGLPIILGVVLSILNREYINVLFTTKIGFMMLGLGAVLMVIGIIWILKIIKIEY